MALYIPTLETPGRWPTIMEGSWQGLGAGLEAGQRGTLSKVSHLSLSDELFIAAVAATGRGHRPRGAISWLADVFHISRPTVYALGKRVVERLRPFVPFEEAEPVTMAEKDDSQGRLNRLVLTSAFPGKVALRPMQEILYEALGETRSIGTLSQFLLETGRRAGEILRQVDHSPLGSVIVVRDETYFQEWPILLVIEPVTTTILLGVVSPDCQADTWGAALLVTQDQGASIAGLIEDMARMYPPSQDLAGVDVDVQKDTWHVSQAGKQVRCDLEREALAAIRQVDKIEKQLGECWQDEVFYYQYIPTVEKMERLLDQHDIFATWYDHLCDALELVDWRSGEVRNRSINGWLLDETLSAMSGINHPRVQSFVRTLRRHQDTLLTFLDWMATSLTAFQSWLAQTVDDPAQQHLFIRIAARCWRLRQALINNQTSFRALARQAEASLLALTQDNPLLAQLATQLMSLLDAAGHTSSLIECINGLLKSFLDNRQAFRNLDTAQAYLNLFILWHNMRIYQRGKRKGKSPFQWAGIDPGCQDWLALLGFPAG
jgi:hypothetical protein